MRAMFLNLGQLMDKKITPVKANAAARLGMVIVGAGELEIQHHKLKPARGNIVRPVTLVRPAIPPLLEDKTAGKKGKRR